jgi:hypothetical protein
MRSIFSGGESADDSITAMTGWLGMPDIGSVAECPVLESEPRIAAIRSPRGAAAGAAPNMAIQGSEIEHLLSLEAAFRFQDRGSALLMTASG